MAWRDDIAVIRTLVDGRAPEGMRGDLREISGDNTNNAREAVRLWADGFGVSAENWRNDIIGIAEAVGAAPRNWREALRFIRDYYEAGATPRYWEDSGIWDDTETWRNYEVI
jgi:hypothetical protein